MSDPKPEPKPPPEHGLPPVEAAAPQDDLERCPRCGLQIELIVWGQTDCPNCGLHFECC